MRDRKFSSISQSASSGAKQLQLSNAALRSPNPSNHTKQSSLGWERMIAYKSVLSVEYVVLYVRVCVACMLPRCVGFVCFWPLLSVITSTFDTTQ